MVVGEILISWSVNDPPELDNLRSQLQVGYHVVCCKLGRLIGSTVDALTQIEEWSQMGIQFTCITQGISTADESAPGNRMRTALIALHWRL